MARETGLEPAASAVTGRRSNQLSYSRKPVICGLSKSARSNAPIVTLLEIRKGLARVKSNGTPPSDNLNLPQFARSRALLRSR